MQKLIDFGLKNFVEWKENILHLIYPNLCLNCENELSKQEQELCFFCEENLKFTSYENYKEESSLDKLFWGRVKLKSTFALLYFEKENQTQKILHQIKYKGKKELAVKMGELMGEKLLSSTKKMDDIDAFIPIPLHIKKIYIRGYNQSGLIASGLTNKLNIETDSMFLTRQIHAESQTKKNRFMRWDNIQEAFAVNENLKNHKHIALIDDVVTTGSTLESCIKMIQEKHPEIEISVFCLAVTK
jgi:competence protein ComFC